MTDEGFVRGGKDERGKLRDGSRPPEDLRRRTKRYGVRIIQLCRKLPRDFISLTIGRQLVRSGTSPGAHYREACRAKSTADFISKMEGALQELDESAYWLELLVEAGVLTQSDLEGLDAETDELISICVTMVRNTKNLR